MELFTIRISGRRGYLDDASPSYTCHPPVTAVSPPQPPDPALNVCVCVCLHTVLSVDCVYIFKLLTWPQWPRSTFLMTHTVCGLSIFHHRPAGVHWVWAAKDEQPPTPSLPPSPLRSPSPSLDRHFRAHHTHFLPLLLRILAQSIPYKHTNRTDETTYFLLMATGLHEQRGSDQNKARVYEWIGFVMWGRPMFSFFLSFFF